MRHEPHQYTVLTPPSAQKFKTLSLWIFFLICCSIYSFLLNLGLDSHLDF